MKNQGWTRRLFAVALITSAAAITFAGAQAQDNTIAKIKARGKLLAGVKFDTPPFGYLDDKNEPVGFDIDLMRKIAEHIGVPVELISVTSPTRIPMLVSGNVDLVAASMTHTRERDKTIDFSITYYTGGQSLLVPKSSTIAGLKDLEGKQVSVQQGTTLEKNIAAAAPKAQVVAFKDYNSAWLALGQGRVDALTGSLNMLQGFAKESRTSKSSATCSASSRSESACGRATRRCATRSILPCRICGPPATIPSSIANGSTPIRPCRSRLGRTSLAK